MRNDIPLDFNHLQQRVKQFNGENISKANFIAKLEERIGNANIQQVKQDVEPFLVDKKELDIWSIEYFLQLIKYIRII